MTIGHSPTSNVDMTKGSQSEIPINTSGTVSLEEFCSLDFVQRQEQCGNLFGLGNLLYKQFTTLNRAS